MSGIQLMMMGAGAGIQYWLNVENSASFAQYPQMTDSAGNIYVVGAATALYKFDRSGTQVWAKYVSGGSLLNLTLGNDGYIYAGGVIGSSGLIIKLNTDGVIQWQQHFGGSNSISTLRVNADTSGNVYSTHTLFVGGNAYIMLTKHDSTGALQWQRMFLNVGNWAQNMYLNPDGSKLYIVGYSNLIGAGSYDPSVWAFDISTSTPSVLYQKTMGGTSGGDYAYDMAADSAGNFYIIGYINGSSVVQKWDSSGVLQWTTQFASSSFLMTTLKLDTSGNIYVFAGIGYIAKLNSSGVLQWGRQVTYSSATVQSMSLTSPSIVSDAITFGVSFAGSVGIGTTAYSYSIAEFIMRVPLDGSKTGSYFVANDPTYGSPANVVYQSVSLSTSNPSYTQSSASPSLTTSAYSSSTSSATIATLNDPFTKTLI